MAAKKRKRPSSPDPLAAYRRVRKPLPPPGRAIESKRRAIVERELAREAERDLRTEDG